MAPYKCPERDIPENEEFNNQLSMVRIRSEHAIGFLKGRFPSLKGVRVNIVNERTHKLATYWVVACIITHAFAMRCEEEEHDPDSDYDPMNDPFVAEGMGGGSRSSSDSEADHVHTAGGNRRGPRSLAEAKARRVKLKEALFRSRQRREERRVARRRGMVVDSDADDD